MSLGSKGSWGIPLRPLWLANAESGWVMIGPLSMLKYVHMFNCVFLMKTVKLMANLNTLISKYFLLYTVENVGLGTYEPIVRETSNY